MTEILVLTHEQLMKLPEYSSSLPTGTTIGKRWRRWNGNGWIVGEYHTSAAPGKVDIWWHYVRRPEQWFKTGIDLVLHPDPRVRDPYGVISRDLIHQVRDRVQVYRDGWNDCSEQRRQKDRVSYVPMQYAEIRDVVMRMVDLPYDLVCQIALNVSPWIDNRTPYWPRDGWVSWEEMSFYNYKPIL